MYLEQDVHYRAGYNPAFVARVREKRRQAAFEAEKAARRREQELAREAIARKAEEVRRESEAKRLISELTDQYRIIEVQATRRPVKDIIADVGERFGFTVADITGPRRSKPLVKVRHLAMRAAADERPDMSLVQIGKIFRRDHSSVCHALSKTRKEGAPR